MGACVFLCVCVLVCACVHVCVCVFVCACEVVINVLIEVRKKKYGMLFVIELHYQLFIKLKAFFVP